MNVVSLSPSPDFWKYLRRLFREHNDKEVAVFALCAEHRGLGADLAPVTNVVTLSVTYNVTHL